MESTSFPKLDEACISRLELYRPVGLEDCEAAGIRMSPSDADRGSVDRGSISEHSEKAEPQAPWQSSAAVSQEEFAGASGVGALDADWVRGVWESLQRIEAKVVTIEQTVADAVATNSPNCVSNCVSNAESLQHSSSNVQRKLTNQLTQPQPVLPKPPNGKTSVTSIGGRGSMDSQNDGRSGEAAHISRAFSSQSRNDSVDSHLILESKGLSGNHRGSTCDTPWPATLERRKEFTQPFQNVRSQITVSQMLHSRAMSVILKSQSDLMVLSASPWQHLVLDPESGKQSIRERFLLLAMFFDIVVMPYVVAFEVPFEGPVQVWGWLAAAVWSVDLVLGFFTGSYHDGELELRVHRIARQYLRSFFVFDLLALLGDTISLVLMSIPSALPDISPAATVGIWRLFLRAVGLTRLRRLQRLFEGLLDRSLADNRRMLFQGLVIFTCILWMNHVLCCVWFFIGANSPSDTGGRWFESLDEVDPGGVVTRFQDHGQLYHYFTAFHCVISQLTAGGLERVSPLNTVERCFNIFCLIFGLIVVSSLVSLISATMTQLFIQKQDHIHQLRELRRFLQQEAVSPRMALRVQRQVHERLKKRKKLTDKDVPALSLLSSNLRMELRYEILQPTILKHPLLRTCDRVDLETMQSLCCEAVDFKNLSQGDNLFDFGQQAKAGMYYISSGKLTYILKSVYSQQHVDTSEEVRAGSWLCEVALWTAWSHTGTATATTPCEMLVFPPEKTLSILFKHSAIKDLVTEYSYHFFTRVVKAIPPTSPPPTDLRVPFTSYGDIVMAMDFDMQAMVGELAFHEAVERGTFDSKSIPQLKSEMQEGLSVPILSEKGEVERIVGITQLRLERSSDLMMLFQIGHLDEAGAAVPQLKLPGIEQFKTELPTDSVRRLLDELAQLAQEVDVADFERDSYVGEGPGYTVPTRYARTTFSACARDGSKVTAKLMPIHRGEVPQAGHHVVHDPLPSTIKQTQRSQSSLPSSSGTWSEHHRSHASSYGEALDLASKYDVFQITMGALSGGLFAWMPEFEVLRLTEDADGQAVLQHWLQSVDCLHAGRRLAKHNSRLGTKESGGASPKGRRRSSLLSFRLGGLLPTGGRRHSLNPMVDEQGPRERPPSPHSPRGGGGGGGRRSPMPVFPVPSSQLPGSVERRS